VWAQGCDGRTLVRSPPSLHFLVGVGFAGGGPCGPRGVMGAH
jgi:hypothetical protein